MPKSIHILNITLYFLFFYCLTQHAASQPQTPRITTETKSCQTDNFTDIGAQTLVSLIGQQNHTIAELQHRIEECQHENKFAHTIVQQQEAVNGLLQEQINLSEKNFKQQLQYKDEIIKRYKTSRYLFFGFAVGLTCYAGYQHKDAMLSRSKPFMQSCSKSLIAFLQQFTQKNN